MLIGGHRSIDFCAAPSGGVTVDLAYALRQIPDDTEQHIEIHSPAVIDAENVIIDSEAGALVSLLHVCRPRPHDEPL